MFQASACDHADATQRRLHRTWTVLRIAEDATGQRFEEKERGRSAREGIGGLGVWGVGMGGGGGGGGSEVAEVFAAVGALSAIEFGAGLLESYLCRCGSSPHLLQVPRDEGQGL